MSQSTGSAYNKSIGKAFKGMDDMTRQIPVFGEFFDETNDLFITPLHNQGTVHDSKHAPANIQAATAHNDLLKQSATNSNNALAKSRKGLM
jgi:hypothetical protein